MRCYFLKSLGASTAAFGERNQWHKHDVGGRVGMSKEREDVYFIEGTKGDLQFFLAAVFSCSVATLIVLIAKYSYVFGYIQRGFGQGDFSGTGTISKAEWTCQGNEMCQNTYYREDVAFYCLDIRSSYH